MNDDIESLKILLAEDVLNDSGGFLFEGYRIDAPGEWCSGCRD